MSTANFNKRLIFGLKINQLRKGHNLSFSDLSNMTGVSVSYLNEIEKGKKFPKDEKLKALAQALKTHESYLRSDELPAHLGPVSDLLNANILQDLPLELFGIDLAKVVDMVANAPRKVGAFISSILEIARNYAVQEENFYFAALRSYQELHNNYFEDLEIEADLFAKKHELPRNTAVPLDRLIEILKSEYSYRIDKKNLATYPELSGIRSVFIPSEKTLLIQEGLTETQLRFLLGKEIAFNCLGLKPRLNTSTILKVDNFEEVLNNFKASYFSVALLMGRESLVQDLKALFKMEKWNSNSLLQLLEKYQASPEMFFHRMTNLIPKYFGLNKLFFLRFNTKPGSNEYFITKELHLAGLHSPHGNGLNEHYCRRWISLWLLDDLYKNQKKGKLETLAGAQRSDYFNSDNEYLCFTIARDGSPSPDSNVSLTLGFKVDADLKRIARFLDDPKILVRTVNQTCQRCAMDDCSERVAPASIIEKNKKRAKMDTILNDLIQGQN